MSTASEWWRDFFAGLPVECWAKAVPPQMSATEADFIADMLKVRPGSKVLDTPCGRGRLALLLAERGLQMTGLDWSVEEIATARATAMEKHLAVEYVQGDIRELPWQATFDGAFCWGNSFAYFDDTGNAQLLEGFSRALRPGGTFVLDAPMMLECLLPLLRDNAWSLVGDVYFLGNRRYDPLKGNLHVDYTFIKGATVDRRTAIYRIYRVTEMLAMLEHAGFRDLTLYSSLTKDPFAYGSPRLIVVAKKGS